MDRKGLIDMRAISLLLCAAFAAGCLAPAAVEPADDVVAALAARPWLDAWTVTSQDFAIDYDPAARMIRAEGIMNVTNELGADRPWLWLLMEPYTITTLEDEAGNKLEWTMEKFEGIPVRRPVPLPLPTEVENAIATFALVNVTLAGDVGPGAVHAIRIAHEGWVSQDASIPAGLPTDAAMNTQFAVIPIASPVPTTRTTYTLTYPSDWVVLGSGGLVARKESGGRTTDSYDVLAGFAFLTSAKGLVWLDGAEGDVAIRTYFWPDMQLAGRAAHELTRRILREAPAWTGPYPYDHIWTVPNRIVQNAFSTPGLTFMGADFYRALAVRAPVTQARSTPFLGGHESQESVVVHEHVHNWWGHNVAGNNSNPDAGPLDRWITEGVTTYVSELVWFREQYGEADAAASARAFIVDQRRGGPGAAEPGGNFYEKTALALRALEAYGIATGRPDAVLTALREVQATEGLLAGGDGVVGTEEMFLAFVRAFNESLRWHLDPYFLSSDLPDLRVASVAFDGANVTIEIAGTGFPTAAQVKAFTLSGREIERWVLVDGTGTVSFAKPVEPIVRVEVDPDAWVYEADEGNNVWVGVA